MIKDKPITRPDGKVLHGCQPPKHDLERCERCALIQGSPQCKDFVRTTNAAVLWRNADGITRGSREALTSTHQKEIE